MAEIKHNNSELFTRLFEQYKEPFARFAYSFVRDMGHQRVKINAAEKIKCKAQADLEFRIGSLENFTTEQLFVDEIGEIVDRTIKSMPLQTRRVFEMSRFENRKNAEIAQILGISVKTVEFHITKMLKVLRENLKDYITCLIVLFYWIS